MFDKPQSSHVLGLDLDAFSLKGAIIYSARGTFRIDHLFETFINPTEEEGGVKPLYIAEDATTLDSLTEENLIVTSLPTQDILVRPLELRLKKDKDIESSLIFQIEPLLPYPPENAIVDKILLSKNKEGSKLTVVAVRKDHLSQKLEKWKNLGIEPEVVSAAPQALTLFAAQFLPKETPFYIFHLGIENSFCVLIDEGKLIAAQAVPEGLNTILDIISKEISSDEKTAFEELSKRHFNLLHTSENASIKSGIDLIRMSITRTIYAMGKQLKGREIDEILFTGPGTAIEGLIETLCQSLNKKRLSIEPFTQETQSETAPKEITSKQLLTYALPIGEALSAIPGCKDQINFRQQEFIYPEPWKRLKHPLVQYIALCIALSISLVIFGKAYSGYKTGEIRRQYTELLDMMNKPYNQFEDEYITKTTPQSTQEKKEPVLVASLTMEDIQSRLNYLEKEIQATPQIFPLNPNVPLVSDVLAWITSHPVFTKKQENENEVDDFVHIDSLAYTMVKRPEPTKKQEKYQVKIELEFSSSKPKKAREFHDALIAPNDIVDPKGEIKWSATRDKYRTSFYLKDKTVYPNH
ncbi:MAG: pilus assembly protein PilM [Parachlamydiaceae bacterium]